MVKGVPLWYLAAANEHFEALYADGEFLSTRKAAELIGKGKSAAADFMAYFRENWRLFNRTDTPEPLPEAEGHTWTDERSGTVFTDLGPDYGLSVLTQGEFRSLRRDYSKLWGGGAMSRADLAYKYRFPSVHAVEIFTRIHGLRQNSIPLTDTELEEDGVEGAVDKVIESRRQAFMMKLQQKEREAEKRDAEKWRTFEVNAHLIAASIKPLPQPDASTLDALLNPAPNPYALVISLSDIHLGKTAYSVDGRLNYDRREAARRAVAAVRDLLTQALVLGRPDEIMLVLCSDGLQADLPMLTTTSGTSMAGQTDGTYREMVEDYLALAREVIGICRAVAVTRPLIVEGNHDRTSSLLIGLLLEQVYAGDSRVQVERQRGDGLIFLNYGETSLAFLHGEYLKSSKDLFRIMLTAAEERGLPLKSRRLSFSGHLHHERVEDLGGIKHHVLPALAAHDEYHRRNFYTGAEVETQAFVIRRSGGKGAVFYTSPSVLRAS
ncbi:hypothetical protein [Deinococcus sp. S9]|uniref:hypothetical protein n=1 Tax=Deinococcus sp. S9 TaxID=2545754 RepID=UPI00105438CB|nr:hypothetical protein [Deinococcus sp. S9]TDE87340.1 hypothetical protein E0686_02270 [Deinococcus sp. S9]